MKSILLLHGAIGSSQQLLDLGQKLETHYEVHTLNFSGHGGKAFNPQFSIEQFSFEVLQYLDDNNLRSIDIFGYSMGGYVALYLAKNHPKTIDRVITLATKLHWDEATATKEAAMLHPEKIAEKVPAFAAELKKRHEPGDWKVLLEKTKEMLLLMGFNSPLTLHDFTAIHCPVLLMLGDRDKMVSLVETVTVYKQLPNAQLAVLPATSHPIDQVDVDMLRYFITR